MVYLDGEPLLGEVDSSLTSGTVGLFTQGAATFDNVLVHATSLTPKVIISNPVAYSLETSSALRVLAVATNVSAGGGVRFALVNGLILANKTSPYAGKFSNVTLSDHTVEPALVNSAGVALVGALPRDTNAAVGARGSYFVAMGDSITNGFADDIGAIYIQR